MPILKGTMKIEHVASENKRKWKSLGDPMPYSMQKQHQNACYQTTTLAPQNVGFSCNKLRITRCAIKQQRCPENYQSLGF